MRYTPGSFPFEQLEAIKTARNRRGNPGKRRSNRRTYKDIISAFDIETTRLREIEQSVMYIWQWHFYGIGTVFGRTWDDLLAFMDRIRRTLHDDWLVVYVHNLSYEFQFLRGIYSFESDEVFAVKSRKVLKCDMFGSFEFRCSYIHSNMSLDEYTKKMGAEHQKLSGIEFDYDKPRYPWTPMSERELDYCENDVLGLCEALHIEMTHDGDSLYTIPLTSTGYVRRDAKHAMREVNKQFVRQQLPSIEVYRMCREAFRGGNTHANRFYAGDVVHNAHSADRSSSYPDVQCNDEFPVSAFFYAGELPLDKVLDLIYKRHRAVLMRIAISGIRLRRHDWGCPYLSRDKCRHIEDAIFDNGRILKAAYLETTITDIDLEILLAEYDFDDCRVFDVSHARYGRLPAPLIRATIGYYKAKTELKNVPGEELYYLKSKNKLNSIYGMMAQDPVKQDILFIDGDFVEQDEDAEELLAESNKRAFLCYQWGCWVTAWARFRLEEGIRLAHEDGAQFLYCDTDSVKYLGYIDWDAYNAKRIAASKSSGAFATDPQGETHYMGVYEQEHDMCEFVTLGAKKYCYRETPDSKLVATIAGVNKKLGGEELEAAGGVAAFKSGFIFRAAGGLEAVYNDRPDIESYEIEGHTLPITSNVVLRESTYTLGITADYMRLLLQERQNY
ncbi:MAG: hypothetical protein KBT02_10190 [Treponema sp.]|nr:hypothetical protein [Candidatus Treponema caballi]